MLAMQKIEMPRYLTLFSPALDWLLQCIANKSTDCCLMPSEQFSSYIMAKTSYISMRWCCGCPFCTRLTCLLIISPVQCKTYLLQLFLDFSSISDCLNLKDIASKRGQGVRVMVFNTTFNNISVISWWSVLLKEENWVHRENHW
jgi:hypothetical protein